MKSIQVFLFSMLMCFSAVTLAEDQVKVDILMAKITKAIKADRAVDALSSFAELESMESTLKNPLPESFHYYYLDALSNSGDFRKALSRSNIYLDKFGVKGKHYGEVIEIKINVEEQTAEDDRMRQKAAIEAASKMETYKRNHENWKTLSYNCESDKSNRIEALDSQKDSYYSKGMAGAYWNKMQELAHFDCDKKYPEPKEPQ